ncbi:MAG TPA: hypothetical protein VGH50_13955 [Candidatus Binatia bacterium]
MPLYLLFRVCSVLLCVLVASQFRHLNNWIFFVYAVTFAHFAVSLIYSRRQVAQAFKQPYGLVPLLSIALITVGLYFGQVSLLYYFALHHAFNEAFILSGTLPSENDDVKAFRGSAVLVHLFLYFFILRGQAGFTLSPWSPIYPLVAGRTGGNRYLLSYLLAGGFAASYAVFFFYLYRIRRFLDRRTLIENCGGEIVGLFIAVVSLSVTFSYLHVVLYHVISWTFYPIPKLWAQGARQLGAYLGLTILSLAGFLLVSPLGLFSSRYAVMIFQKQFIMWTYIHITASFVLSNAHPDWIVNLFRHKRYPAVGAPVSAPTG